MADVTITIPDAEVTRVLTAFGNQLGYTGTNPQGQAETRAQFARRKLREYIVTIVKQHEGSVAERAARTTSDTSVDSIGIT